MSRYRIACVLLAAALPAAADDWEKSYDAGQDAELRVESGDANIRITGTDSGGIEARVTTKGWRIADDEVRIIETQTGNRVSIEVRLPRGRWGWSGGINRSVNIEISAPSTCSVYARTGDGNIDIEDITGGARASTGDGRRYASCIQRRW